MNALATPPADPTVRLPAGEPEQNRRYRALLEAWRLGVVVYVGSYYDEDQQTHVYPVIYRDEVWLLYPDDIYARLHTMAAAMDPALADKLTYRPNLRPA